MCSHLGLASFPLLMFPRFVDVVACMYQYFIPFYDCVLFRCGGIHLSCIHSLADTSFVDFHSFWAVMNKAAMNIYVKLC